MSHLTGTLLNAYLVCSRKAWLLSRELVPDPQNDMILLGKLISETTYERAKREINFENVKFDLIEKSGTKVIVGEVKKSSSFIKSARVQLGYYLLKLKEAGVEAHGELLIPRERKRLKVELTPQLESTIRTIIKELKDLIRLDTPPEPERKPYCKSCAYREFCFA